MKDFHLADLQHALDDGCSKGLSTALCLREGSNVKVHFVYKASTAGKSSCPSAADAEEGISMMMHGCRCLVERH